MQVVSIINIHNVVILSIIVLISCGTNKQSMVAGKCSFDRASKVSKEYLEKNKYDVSELNQETTSTDTTFKFTYTLDYKKYRGGGAEIIVSKESCKIIDSKLYQ